MRNPISEIEMVDGIVNALERLNRDKAARVAILTGAGTAFSSGGDLRRCGPNSKRAPKNRI